MKNEEQDTLNYLKNTIRNVPDFPKPGIQFKDITPLLKDAKALRLTSDLLIKPFSEMEIDYVAGLESRGFIFGPILAKALNAGFILIRKPGKLPAQTLTATYQLEYGEDCIEMHQDAIKEGARVLIHDDLIATGGSAKAATDLIQQAGGTVSGYSFIIELADLMGRNKLDKDAITDILISF